MRPSERNNPHHPPMLDALAVRRLRRQVALCHVVVSPANANQFVQKHARSLHTGVVVGICARSQLQAGPLARAGTPKVERNTVPAFQPPRCCSP